MKWPSVALSDVCVLISSGGTPSRKHPEYYEDGTIPWVKSQELRDGRIYQTDEMITELGLKRSSAKYYDPGTILIAMYGATVGKLAILGCAATVNQAVCGLVPDPSLIDRDFLYYSLLQWRDGLTAKAHGAAQQNLNQGLIRDFPIPLPPLALQRRIASILSAYDDLIENNTRRIAILEEMAQAIYREWFVDFRFPGHEGVEMVESELGLIPEGWESAPISEALTFRSGKPIKKDEREGGPTPVFGANGVIGFTKQAAIFGPCVVLGKIGSCGSLHRSFRSCWISNNAFGVKTALITSLELAWNLLRAIDFHGYVGGSANPYMPESAFGHHRVAIPPQDLQARFHGIVEPLSRLQDVLARQADGLRQTRDLLLPKLVSGEIEVSQFSDEMDEAVA